MVAILVVFLNNETVAILNMEALKRSWNLNTSKECEPCIAVVA